MTFLKINSEGKMRIPMTFAVAAMAAPGLSDWAYAEKGLVAHYTFDEGPGKSVKDSSGNRNDGKIIGDVTYVKIEGGKGHALSFNTGNAYVDCGNTPSLDLTDAVTLELWFQPETAVWGGGVVGKVMGSYCLSYADRCLFTPQAGQTLGLHPP